MYNRNRYTPYIYIRHIDIQIQRLCKYICIRHPTYMYIYIYISLYVTVCLYIIVVSGCFFEKCVLVSLKL